MKTLLVKYYNELSKDPKATCVIREYILSELIPFVDYPKILEFINEKNDQIRRIDRGTGYKSMVLNLTHTLLTIISNRADFDPQNINLEGVEANIIFDLLNSGYSSFEDVPASLTLTLNTLIIMDLPGILATLNSKYLFLLANSDLKRV